MCRGATGFCEFPRSVQPLANSVTGEVGGNGHEGEVVLLGCGLRCGIVDRPGDLGPVQSPAAGYRQTIEKEALGASAALPERMRIVDLVIVIGQAFDELIPIQVL